MKFRAKVNIIFKKKLWVVAIVELKRHVISIGILNIIVCKLSYWQEAYLIILFQNHKDSEVYFHYIILFFYLAISLKIEDCEKSLLNS